MCERTPAAVDHAGLGLIVQLRDLDVVEVGRRGIRQVSSATSKSGIARCVDDGRRRFGPCHSHRVSGTAPAVTAVIATRDVDGPVPLAGESGEPRLSGLTGDGRVCVYGPDTAVMVQLVAVLDAGAVQPTSSTSSPGELTVTAVERPAPGRSAPRPGAPGRRSPWCCRSDR